ncbi:MAG: OB-fold protein [Actinomycetota bacterium]
MTDHNNAYGPQPTGPWQGPATPPLKPKKKKKWPWIVGIIAALFIFGSIGNAIGGDDKEAVAAAEADAGANAEAQAKADAEQAAEAEAAEEKAEAERLAAEEEAEKEAEEQRKKEEAEAKAEAKAAKAAEKARTVKVDAASLLAEYEGNEAAADEKYQGKVLQVTGTVEKVDTEFWDKDQYVVQLNDGSQWNFIFVNCNDVEKKQAAKIQAGSTVTVRGEFDDGGDLGVEIKDCKVL